MTRLLLAIALALAASPAFAAWDLSRLIGPLQAPIYGAAVTDPVTGAVSTPIIGYLAGLVFVLPADQVTAAMQPYAGPVPAGLPVLAGVPSVALTFPDLATAQSVLAAYWRPD